MAESATIKPKAEIDEPGVKPAKPRKARETVAAEAAPTRAKSKKTAEAKAEEPKAQAPRKSSAVPKVPRKK